MYTFSFEMMVEKPVKSAQNEIVNKGSFKFIEKVFFKIHVLPVLKLVQRIKLYHWFPRFVFSFKFLIAFLIILVFGY